MEFQKAYVPSQAPEPRRILVIRRNRIGDMICTLPLLHALRRRFPKAHIAVACDRAIAPVAEACPAVDAVHVLIHGWLSLAVNALRLRGYDAVIAVKGGFDKRLGMLARLTDAPVRIGFHYAAGQRRSRLYTHPVALPPDHEHQVATCLRLLSPWQLEDSPTDMTLQLPAQALHFAKDLLKKNKHPELHRVAVLNVSCNRPMKWSDADFVSLARHLTKDAGLQVAISCVPTPPEIERAKKILAKLERGSAFLLECATVIELAAVLKNAALVVTPEGGVIHLAAAVGAPAVVLWWEGNFPKWTTHSKNHRHLLGQTSKQVIRVSDAWQAARELLDLK